MRPENLIILQFLSLTRIFSTDDSDSNSLNLFQFDQSLAAPYQEACAGQERDTAEFNGCIYVDKHLAR